MKGLGGKGALSGVAGLTGDQDGYCAMLTAGEVNCWGAGATGDLGNGQFYSQNPFGSALPVQVVDGLTRPGRRERPVAPPRRRHEA